MTDRLTLEREAEIRQREADATPGPWEHDGLGDVYCRRTGVADGDGHCIYEAVALSPQTRIRDSEFIAHARADVTDLLAELDAVRRERDALLDAARDVLYEECGPEHADCVPRSGCAWAVLRAAVASCAPKEGT